MRARHGITAGALLGASVFGIPGVASANLADPDARPVARIQATHTVKVVKARPSAPRPPALRVVVVRPGDNLSQIGESTGRTWEQLAGFNHIANPNLILPGQRVVIPPASYRPPPISLPTPALPPAPVQAPVKAQAPVYTAPVVHHYTYSAPQVSGTFSVGSGFEACVVARESGGNSQIMGGAGGQYYGLYQFSYSTWVANGGAPGDWGHASAAEQHAVFARSSPSNWAPYDGC